LGLQGKDAAARPILAFGEDIFSQMKTWIRPAWRLLSLDKMTVGFHPWQRK